MLPRVLTHGAVIFAICVSAFAAVIWWYERDPRVGDAGGPVIVYGLWFSAVGVVVYLGLVALRWARSSARPHR